MQKRGWWKVVVLLTMFSVFFALPALLRLTVRGGWLRNALGRS